MLIVAAIACGWVGWSGYVLALPVAMMFPALWALSYSRMVAALVSAGYFLAASRGLPLGVANFFAADLWPGLLLWLAASVSFVVVHAAAWSRQPGEGRPGRGNLGKPNPGMGISGKGHPERWRAMRYLVATVLMALPPFGITGWAQPITAAGVLFPGWGWWGLAATAASLAMMTSRGWPATAIVLGGFWAWSAASWTPATLPPGWKGVDLQQGQTLGRDASLDHHRDLIATVRSLTDPPTRFIVLPESTLGFWTPTVERLWQDGLRGLGVTVIAGASVPKRQGYDNVLVAISANRSDILYRERMPVPVSMWQPWRAWKGQGGGASADFFANPAASINGTRVAPLICYEQLIVWPALQSMLHAPDVTVAVGNGWWTAGTSIVAIQKASTIAWAKLFRRPLVMAFNT
ncbi:conjugal transfer protein TraB [Brucella intermedia]|uniref:conjugal transfer protein TraB n=1 Tax=Brucella intermedia TaxID=94625 RepID=UPI002360B3F5|nr:conjugal transfer protein TraB [Brucella intermedia]